MVEVYKVCTLVLECILVFQKYQPVLCKVYHGKDGEPVVHDDGHANVVVVMRMVVVVMLMTMY